MRVDLFDMRSQIGSTSGPSRSPAPSQPQHHTVTTDKSEVSTDTVSRGEGKRQRREGRRRTEVRPRLKVDRDGLLFGEEAVVGAEPRAVLRVRARVVGQAAEADVPADRAQVPPVRVDDLVHAL